MQDERALREQARQAVRAAAGDGHSSADPARLQRHARRVLQDQLARIRHAHAPPACARGCALCCHLRVMATPAEVFALVRYLRRELDRQAMDAAAARIAGTAARLHALPRERLLATNIACPPLEDNACSMYPARPFNCRAYHSLDYDACLDSFRNPEDTARTHPQSALVARVNEGVQQGLGDGLRQAGVDARQYELVTALDEALTDPDAEARFGRGEPAFNTALRP